MDIINTADMCILKMLCCLLSFLEADPSADEYYNITFNMHIPVSNNVRGMLRLSPIHKEGTISVLLSQ